MAQPCTRTYCDDAADALALLDDAQRELANWRAHLNALASDPQPNPGRALQAKRCGEIVAAAINAAACNTRDAVSDVTRISH
jgi:hypothetical protein